MNIAIISPGISGGGAERVANILANYFKNEGYNVSFIYMRDDPQWVKQNPSIQYECVDNQALHGIKKYLYKTCKTWKIIKNQKIDVVISFLTDEALATMLLFKGIKISSLRNDPRRTCTKLYTKAIRHIVYSISDYVVFQTTDAKKYFGSMIQYKGQIIPNPITGDLPRWIDEERHENIITACRLEPQKNLKMLMDAFNRLSIEGYQGKLIIFGEGILEQELKDYAFNYLKNKMIVFPGFSNSIHDEMKKASVFALSSDYEGISNSMLEALAIGVPTVCTDCPVGGARMFIGNNERGLLVPVGDTDALYNALKKLTSDISYCLDLSNREITIRDELKISTICQRWKQLLIKKR